MRFKLNNWNRCFDGHNKETTLRLKKSKLGHAKAYAGSYYHPKLLGEFDIVHIETLKYGLLNESDARADGFDTLQELKDELESINGKLSDDTLLYQHWMENIKKVE